MDHRRFLDSLPAVDKNRLHEKLDGPGLIRIAIQMGIIVLLAIMIGSSVPGWPALMVLQGILLAFLFNLEHECTHKTPFRTEWINEWAGRISGFLIFQPFLWFRYFHLAHHRHTNDPEKDPELLGKPKPKSWVEYAVFLSSVLYWRGKVVTLFQNAFGTAPGDFIPKSAFARLRLEARVSLGFYVLIFVISIYVSTILLWVWIIPLFIGNPVLRLYHLAEHGRCPSVDNMFENTRTVFTNRLVLYFCWNMPFHIEHHAAPNVPFHRLDQLNQLIKQHLISTSNGYGEFTKEYAAGLTFKGDRN